MDRFSNAREAKEFLVSGSVAEAQREHVELSEVERKMLYFSETGWTLPDIMEVNDRFDREYDQAKYEKKIARLIGSAMKRASRENPGDFTSWVGAIRKLKKEDHYILVMVRQAGVSTGSISDKWKTTALVIILLVIVISFNSILRYFGLWMPRYGRDYGSYRINERLGTFVGYAWLCLVAVYVCGVAFLHFDPKRRVYKIVDTAIVRAFRIFRPR
jgi:hypothetical protein